MAGRGVRSKQNKAPAAKPAPKPAAKPSAKSAPKSAAKPAANPGPLQPVASPEPREPPAPPVIATPDPPEPLQPVAQPPPAELPAVEPEMLQPVAQPESPPEEEPEPRRPIAPPAAMKPEPPEPVVPPSPPPAPSRPVLAPLGRRRRDPRRWIYAGLDLLFAAIYAVAISTVIPNRLPSATLHLWTFPVASLAMAIGMLLGRRSGWWVAVIGGSLALLSMALLIVRIAISAAFLAGVYGAFGKAAATFALVMIALVIELVALLPIVQVKYLMTRAGRHALGKPSP